MKKIFNQVHLSTVLLIIFSAVISGMLYNSFSENSIEFIRHEENLVFASDSLINSLLDSDADLSFKPQYISLNQAKFFFDSQKAFFVDARDEWDFTENHIPGALNIPEYEYEPGMPRLQKLNKERLYIIYCGEECDLSRRLAIYMASEGFKHLFVIEGGWTEWTLSGYPTEKGGENAESL